MGVPGAFWGRTGASWGRPGASWGRLGGVMGPLGASWEPLGGRPGESWGARGSLGGLLGGPGSSFGAPDIDFSRGSLKDRSGIGILPPRASPAEDKRRYNYLLGVVKSSKEVNRDLTRRWAEGPGEFPASVVRSDACDSAGEDRL